MGKIKWALFVAFIFVFIGQINAKDTVTVEVDKLASFKGEGLPPYKERKSWFGGEFGLNSFRLTPKNFQSAAIPEPYDVSYGVPISITEGTLGIRINTNIVSIGLGGGYGSGTISQGLADAFRGLTLTTRRIMASIYLDGFFDEPYVVPYATAGTYNLMYSQTLGINKPTNNETGSANYMQFGILIQLNGLDDKSFYDGYLNWGVENSFLDIYSISFQKSSVLTDPDFASSGLGVGLKVEF